MLSNQAIAAIARSLVACAGSAPDYVAIVETVEREFGAMPALCQRVLDALEEMEDSPHGN